MATLTIRRLEEADRDWLRRAARDEGVSMEEYVRRMLRRARLATTQRFGDVLDELDRSLSEEDRALLGDAPVIERPPPSGAGPVPRRRGRLDDHLSDVLIAATASVHGLVVLTRNERQFRATGVPFENPWTLR